ncbi:manno-octulosonate cytidylyltransferase [Brucella gallinifaecis]|uniref:3-deoxy-manno-octulosonate cytidylyltransferase n=1 Tax=Brucella gallinifaecis TaxID=215590 RepID=A0A502BN96_9HYPH|nr:manno-octulosonate cytidylyltransferase [Brucella gallinifaecis]TPF75350.1 3-deoxy-manno-octulosonate cytidylyltransferase [Brucella gallinifaecis]
MLQTLKTLTLIPARMASVRLPNKPLADICGKPMIVHVADRAVAAKLGRTVVATDSEEIFAAVQAHGHEAIMTRSDHESGSDRIYEALQKLDPDGEIEAIVNVQGDLPTIDPETIRRVLLPLVDGPADIATLGVEITVAEEKTNPNVVKIVGSPKVLGSPRVLGSPKILGSQQNEGQRLHALYFTRATAPYGDGPLYHHIGLYAYRRAALERFVKIGPSALEKREKLEQLRALEDGMRIEAEIVRAVPLGVDTQADLDRAREIIAKGL